MPSNASPTKRSVSPKKSQTSSAKKPAKKELPQAGGDIRNFFGNPSSGSSKKAAAIGNGTGQKPITIDDSDEEEEKVESQPKPVKTTTSKHFQTSAASSSKTPIVLDDSPEPAAPPSKLPTSASKSKSTSSYKRKAVISDSDSDEDSKPAKKRQSTESTKPAAKAASYIGSSSDEDVKTKKATSVRSKSEKAVTPQKAASKAKGKAVVKKDSRMDVDSDSQSEADFDMDGDEDDDDLDIDDDDEDVPKKSKPAKKPTPKKKPDPKVKVEKKEQTPKAESSDKAVEEKKPKVDWKAIAAQKAQGPKAPGSKDIPMGAPNCLAGLTFVFTGELESLGREEAAELVKRYSGRVTGAPSGKTSYVVVGENAGDSKMKKIKELGVKTLSEDGLLDLIRTRKGAKLDEKQLAAQAKEEKKVLEMAAEMEKKEKEEEKLRVRKEAALEGTGIPAKKIAPASSQLWTTKYAPQNMKEICGNKAGVERLGTWLADWQKNYIGGFKKPGKDGMGLHRAVLISGPPGIGKTTSAHIMAKQAGYNPIELNASDARSKKLVENSTNIDNASLDGFFQGSGVKSTTVAGVPISQKTCLIMDEVDGMSAGDRGGVGALNALIKKTKIPMILICNDRTLQKMKPLQGTTFSMTFKRPQPAEVRSRIMSILYKEKLKIPPNVVDELVKGANSDLRQVLNMLSTFKLSKSEMDFDEGKEMIRVNEKNTIMTPFTIIDRLTGPYAFSRTNRESLNDKMELYFHDFSFVPLFMQEHYLKTVPTNTNKLEGQMKDLKHLELISKAADSISDGDLIDRMIHGSEQHWSLLPTHAVASTVRPAFFIYGGGRSNQGSWGGPSFPQWLGQNSKQGKLGRLLTDIQIKMRLRVSGSREAIREQYMPMLASKLVLPLVNVGQDALEEMISVMDEYYLNKEDWDAFVELGVDTMRDEALLKKIPTAVKSAFTRQYNKADHPIAFHKGDMFAASKKKVAPEGAAPDNEEVFEEDEVPEETSDKEDNDEEVNDLTKDKLIKAVKPKGKGKAATEKKVKK